MLSLPMQEHAKNIDFPGFPVPALPKAWLLQLDGLALYPLEGVEPLPLWLPLVLQKACAGFPSPAADYQEERLDLADLLIQHPAATFLVRASGESMINEGIMDGDLLIVDRSIKPVSGHIVLAALNGELAVKKLRYEGGRRRRAYLESANPQFPPIEITGNDEFVIWGVVAHAVHHLLQRRY